MSVNFENNYISLIRDIMVNGEIRKCRNGITRSLFGKTLDIDLSGSKEFPLLLGRRIFYKGVFGEMAAFLRGPKHLSDFEKFGCNYWKDWVDKDGNLRVDYGNLWLDFNGVNQLQVLKDTLKNNPTDRRMIISGWNPANLIHNSLPCCHLLYQWYVREGKYLDMIWYQRSVDTMIGLPSDIVLAAIWNIMLANEVGLNPGKLIFMLGDTHIYEKHFDNIYQYIENYNCSDWVYPEYRVHEPSGFKTEDFTPSSIEIIDYNPVGAVKFEVIA